MNHKKKKGERVILSSFLHTSHIDLAVELKRIMNWEPVYWLSIAIEKEIKAAFPDSVFHSMFEARRGLFPSGEPKIRNRKVDGGFFESLSKHEADFMNILSRSDMDGWCISYEERKELYFGLLDYWASIIEEKGITLALFWVIPHGTETFTLYLVCKYLGIPTLFIEPGIIFEKRYMASASIFDRSSLIRMKKAEFKNKKRVLALNEDSDNYLQRLNSDYGSVTPEYLKKPWGREIAQGWGELKEDLNKFMEVIRTDPFKKARFHMKISRASMKHQDSDFSNLGRFLYLLRSKYRNKKLKKLYRSFCETPDLNSNYVYFAANYQPEATTTPAAGYYTDLYLCLTMLSRSIPTGWKIYFKENMAIFWPMSEGFRARNADYYKKISALGNVVFVSDEFETFKLIDSSRFVAAATGTVILESVVRGKNALIFGSAWYQECEGVWKIGNYEQLRIAVDRIIEGNKPSPKKIKEYASLVEELSVPDVNVYGYVTKYDSMPDKEHVIRRLAHLFIKGYETLSSMSVEDKKRT